MMTASTIESTPTLGEMRRVVDLIGNTPLVEIGCFDVGLCRLFVKLESHNPGGSIKDRIALSMLEQAERDGQIKPGGTLIEATAGNTGLGLALIAITKGYKLLLVIPDKMSTEKINHLKAMGVEVILTRSDVGKGHPEYYQDMALRLSREIPNSFFINQFANPANALAHEIGTGPEIWEQTNGQVDAIVVGVGSSGTLKGLTDYFQRTKPDLEIVLADPVGSILTDYINRGVIPDEVGSWFIEGIGEDFIPPLFDKSMVKKAFAISDGESFAAARTLLRKEGILAGSSTGTLLSAAVRYAREQTTPKNIVTFVCDSGNKYLTKMFNDFWMTDQGFLPKETQGNLEDLITRKHSERTVVTAKPDDTLLSAHSKMRLYDISQLPVLEDGRIVGIIDEWDILTAIENRDEQVLKHPIKDYMSTNVLTVSINDPIDKVARILRKDYLVIVTKDDRFHGLISKMDYISYLRRKLR